MIFQLADTPFELLTGDQNEAERVARQELSNAEIGILPVPERMNHYARVMGVLYQPGGLIVAFSRDMSSWVAKVPAYYAEEGSLLHGCGFAEIPDGRGVSLLAIRCQSTLSRLASFAKKEHGGLSGSWADDGRMLGLVELAELHETFFDSF